MCYAILKVLYFVLQVSQQVYTHPRSKNIFLIIYTTHHRIFQRVWKRFIQRLSLSKPLFSESLLCSDWSDGPVCCDWSILLWLVYSALIGQMSQSVDLVYSALIGQMAQSVVIGLLCSDWSTVPVCRIGLLSSDCSGGPVCCDWSTLLWLVRWPSLLWLVYSALIGQLSSDWSDTNGALYSFVKKSYSLIVFIRACILWYCWFYIIHVAWSQDVEPAVKSESVWHTCSVFT